MINLEVGKKYYSEWSENHCSGLKWTVFEFEVVRIDDNFPLSTLTCQIDAGEAEDMVLEFAIVKLLNEIDLSMNSLEDAGLPVIIEEQKNEWLTLVREAGKEWYCTWWPVEACIDAFVERTPADWVKVKQDYADKFKEQSIK